VEAEEIRRQQLLFLTEVRPLDVTIEETDIILGNYHQLLEHDPSWHFAQTLPVTEAQVLMLLWEQILILADLRKPAYQLVEIPMK
jgi:hypothetical protein